MTVIKENGVWIARKDGKALFFTDVHELRAMIQRLGWA